MALVHEGQEMDVRTLKAGFRDAEFRAEGFFLNGQRVHLRGLNRHQSWPYIGYAAPAGMKRDEANYLKFSLGLNIVRTSHYPQSRLAAHRRRGLAGHRPGGCAADGAPVPAPPQHRAVGCAHQ